MCDGGHLLVERCCVTQGSDGLRALYDLGHWHTGRYSALTLLSPCASSSCQHCSTYCCIALHSELGSLQSIKTENQVCNSIE